MKAVIGQIKLREATVAGIFYPDDPSELEARIESLLSAADPVISNAKAILSPHAGLDYSGDLSALAWKSAAGANIDTVLVLSPLHQASDSLVYLPESDCFDIPTGRIQVDRGIVEEMRDCGTLMSVNDIPHFEEHGVELQLPFMHALFPSAHLVPVLLGKPSPAVVKALASALALVFADRIESTLVVISSDLGSAMEEHIAAACADRFLRGFLASDAKLLLDDLSAIDGSACGTGCASAFFSSGLSRGMRPIVLARHDSSASRELDEERLVHYAAVAFSDA
jgi:AmmeMemoRadiSam system protein B